MDATTRPATRAQLLRQMRTLFADDPGLRVLVDAGGRREMSETRQAMQTAWVTALIALHGRDRAAAVYSEYARERRRAEAATLSPIGSWDNLYLGFRALAPWDRDIHGFLCVICGDDVFPVVLIDHGQDPACRRCAREHATPETALPLWQAYSHDRFVFPGVLRGEMPHGPAILTMDMDGAGEQRHYTCGDFALFDPTFAGLPGLRYTTVDALGEDRDRLQLYVRTSVGAGERGYDIVASLTYDPEPEGFEQHPYGFRFTAARLTATHAPRSAEYTDVYAMLDAVLAGLHLGQQVRSADTELIE
ncbi:hypothetical protein [Nocardia sp. IFM 10818]